MLFERAHFVATTPKPKSKKAAMLGLSDSATGAKKTVIKQEGNKTNVNELKYFEDCIDKLAISGINCPIWIKFQCKSTHAYTQTPIHTNFY